MKPVTFVSTAIFALALCGTAYSDVVSNVTVPINQAIFIPCTNNGVGENVALNGPLHILAQVTLNKGDAHVKFQANPQDVTGIGSVTHYSYKATGITRDDVNIQTTNGFPANETYINNFRIVGKGAAPSLLVHETLHYTVNANGTITASHDNLSASCK